MINKKPHTDFIIYEPDQIKDCVKNIVIGDCMKHMVIVETQGFLPHESVLKSHLKRMFFTEDDFIFTLEAYRQEGRKIIQHAQIVNDKWVYTSLFDSP